MSESDFNEMANQLDADQSEGEYIMGQDQQIYVGLITAEKDYESGKPFLNVMFKTSRQDKDNHYPGALIVNRPCRDLASGNIQLSHGQRVEVDDFNQLTKEAGYKSLSEDAVEQLADGKGVIYDFNRLDPEKTALAYRGNVVRDRTLTDRKQYDVPDYKAGYVQLSSLQFDPDFDVPKEKELNKVADLQIEQELENQQKSQLSPSKGGIKSPQAEDTKDGL